MPYWFEKLKVGKKRDRRRKLTDKDKKKIKYWYKEGVAIREITRRIGKVDRNAIRYFLFPSVREKQRIRLRDHHWYYDKEKNTISMQRHRQYKKELFGLKK